MVGIPKGIKLSPRGSFGGKACQKIWLLVSEEDKQRVAERAKALNVSMSAWVLSKIRPYLEGDFDVLEQYSGILQNLEQVKPKALKAQQRIAERQQRYQQVKLEEEQKLAEEQALKEYHVRMGRVRRSFEATYTAKDSREVWLRLWREANEAAGVFSDQKSSNIQQCSKNIQQSKRLLDNTKAVCEDLEKRVPDFLEQVVSSG